MNPLSILDNALKIADQLKGIASLSKEIEFKMLLAQLYNNLADAKLEVSALSRPFKFETKIMEGLTPNLSFSASATVITNQAVLICESISQLLDQHHIQQIANNPSLQLAFEYFRLTGYDESPQARQLGRNAKRYYTKRSDITHGRTFCGFENELNGLKTLVLKVLTAASGFEGSI